MDSEFSKNLIVIIDYFLSLKAFQGGLALFDNGKKDYILGVGKIGKSLGHTINDESYESGLKYNLSYVS